jgi:kinetochore protein Spc25
LKVNQASTIKLTSACADNPTDQRRQRKQAIAESESKSSNHAHILAKESQEKEEMQDAIQSLTAQREDHLAQRDQTKAEIASVQATVRQRREAQAAHQRSLDSQARHNVPELRFWETCLGLRIEGTGVEDQLKFVFLNMDERDLDRQCWFELQMGGREWAVVAAKPRLDRDSVSAVQGRFNETRQLGELFKGMRKLLSEALRT